MTTETPLAELARTTHDRVSDYLAASYENPFEMGHALVMGLNPSEEPQVLDVNPDIYAMLCDNPLPSYVLANFETIAIVTTGWASPLGENGEVEGKPSEHPQRRRVRLVVTGSPNGIASALCFSDDPEEVVIDEGHATGSLADAFFDYINH